MNYHNEITHKMVQELYHDENGDPIVLTPGQLEIFDCIALKLHPRVWCGTYTQFGKSMTTALGVLTRVTHYPEKWTIIAPKNDQAQIIMGYIIDHIFDNELIASKFEIDKGESAERIRRERSKDKITFKMTDGSIGGVQVLSVQGTRRKNILDAILGFGSQHVIFDESSITPDDHFAGVLRMLGGFKENFLMQIGNTVYRNHFFKASKNPRYHKILVDYRQGIAEGRISEEFIEEARDEMKPKIFRILYECKFPEADMIDDDGYSPLITVADLTRAIIPEVKLVGEPRMAIDVAGGGRNETVAVVRTDNGAKVALRTNEADHMVIGPKIIQEVRKYGIKARNVGIDAVGIGHGLFNYLQQELGKDVQAVKAGSKAETTEKEFIHLEFADLRALMFRRMQDWIGKGGKLQDDPGFNELEDIRYDSKKNKIIIKSKKEMQRDGVESPDTADALAMTFAWPESHGGKTYKPKPYIPQTPYEGGDRPSQYGNRENRVPPKSPYDRYAQGF